MSRVRWQAGTLTFKFAKRGITEANLLLMANHLLSSSIMTDPALTRVYGVCITLCFQETQIQKKVFSKFDAGFLITH